MKGRKGKPRGGGGQRVCRANGAATSCARANTASPLLKYFPPNDSIILSRRFARQIFANKFCLLRNLTAECFRQKSFYFKLLVAG